nr:zinc finger, CCHC-type [Tanacetum cinerariifolium]
MLHMKEDETIDTFTTKLTTLVNKAASLGHTMEDGTLVRKLLNAVPDRYLQIDSESLDGGVTKSMNQPRIKEDTYTARTTIERQSVGTIINHNYEGGSNQKNMINMDILKLTTVKVEATEGKIDLLGYKDCWIMPKYQKDWFDCCLAKSRKERRVIALALMRKMQVGIVFARAFFLQLAGIDAHTEYDGYKETDPQICWFWE